jgi:small nuclear ribonucleoprotein (snRNP)-like protein
MLNKRLRVTVTDGRVLTGQFYCFDNLRNIMLSETKEAANSTDTSSRHLGLVLIPWKWVVSCHLEQLKPRFPD